MRVWVLGVCSGEHSELQVPLLVHRQILEWTLLCSLLGGLLPGWTFECCSLPVRTHVSQVWAYGENPGTVCACVTVSVPMSEPVDLEHVSTVEAAGVCVSTVGCM